MTYFTDSNIYTSALYKAMQGRGTDEDAIASIFKKITSSDFLIIKDRYEKKYSKNLVSHLSSELGIFDAGTKRRVSAVINPVGFTLY